MSHGVTCQLIPVASAARTFDLEPVKAPAVSGGEQSAAPADTSVSKAGCSNISIARGGVACSAQPSPEVRTTIIETARPLVISQIKELLGNDVKCWRLHKKYLEGLKFSALCARRDQLLAERLPMQLDLQPNCGGAES